MFCDRIRDGDYLYRYSVHPLSFHRDIFDQSRLFHLVYNAASDAILGSLAWERFVPTHEYIHAYGCRLAKKRNDKKRAEGKLNRENRQIYCGAYGLRARFVRALVGAEELAEVASADITHLVEDGEIAHAELKIVLVAGTANVESTKTAILDRLWNASCGPLTHICDYDDDLDEHPSTSLSIGRGGEYVDTRSYLSLLWCIVRFHICSWLWRHGYLRQE